LFVTQYKNDNTAFHRSFAVLGVGGRTLESDVAAVLNCEKLIDNLACLKTRKKLCSRLWAVGYVGGIHLVSVDADSYIFSLFFMDTIACAMRTTYGNGFKCALQKGLEHSCSQTLLLGW